MEDNRIKEYRDRMGISQVELSRKARIAAPNLSSIERRKLEAWPKAKRRLAKVLKCTEAELFPNEKGGKDGE